MLITGSQALYELNLHFINVFRSEKELSWAGPGLSKVGRMKNTEYMAAALSSDDELTLSLSMESCNGESKDLMEAVKEGKRALSPANESEEGRRRRERERRTEQKRDGPVKDRRTKTLHVLQSTTLTWTHMDTQILLTYACSC